MKGLIIDQKYTLGSYIGSFGQVFRVKDQAYAIKFSFSTETFGNEIRTLQSMQRKRDSQGVTQIIDHGHILLNNFGEDREP